MQTPKQSREYQSNMNRVMKRANTSAKTNISRHHTNLIKIQKEKDSEKLAELNEDLVKAKEIKDENLIEEAENSISSFEDSAKKNIAAMEATMENDLK